MNTDLLRRLTNAAQAVLAAGSPDHTWAPTDEQWGELGAAADAASAFLDSERVGALQGVRDRLTLGGVPLRGVEPWIIEVIDEEMGR